MGYENLDKLIETVRILRSPEGCEWDRAQTHNSLRPNMLEEAYEAVDAMDSGDMKHLKEELGDVLLQVLLHAQIADDEGDFNLDDVAKGLNEKLIHRHPHVFGNVKVNSTQDIIDNWDKLKKEEKARKDNSFTNLTKILYEFLEEMRIEEVITSKIQKLEEKGFIEIANEYESSFKVLIELFDEIVLVFGEEKTNFDKYMNILKIGLKV